MYKAGLPPDTARNKNRVWEKNAFNALTLYYTQAESSRYALKIHYHGSEKNKNDDHSVKVIYNSIGPNIDP